MKTSKKLNILADFLATVDEEKLIMINVHNLCGTAHCAWGWGEVLELFPRGKPTGGLIDGVPWFNTWDKYDIYGDVLGLSERQNDYCFGFGSQFDYLDRKWTREDVVRHLLETAIELEAEGN